MFGSVQKRALFLLLRSRADFRSMTKDHKTQYTTTPF